MRKVFLLSQLLTGLLLVVSGLGLMLASLWGIPTKFELGGLLPHTSTRIAVFLMISGIIFYGGVCVLERYEQRTNK